MCIGVDLFGVVMSTVSIRLSFGMMTILSCGESDGRLVVEPGILGVGVTRLDSSLFGNVGLLACGGVDMPPFLLFKKVIVVYDMVSVFVYCNVFRQIPHVVVS